MKRSSYPEITDELLSAYIDNAVSDAERALIEQAMREDTTVAWRLATLRETVNLLRAMPVLQAPRAFTLTAEQLGQPVRTPALVPGVIAVDQRSSPQVQPAKSSPRPGRWAKLSEQWRGFWQTGSPVWRNAMAASMALLLVMVVAPAFFGSRGQTGGQMAAAPVALEREIAPAGESSAALGTESAANRGEPSTFSAPELATAKEPAPAEPSAVEEDRAEVQPEVMPTTLAAAPAMDEPVIAAAALAQPSDAVAARIAPPSAREEDPVNPQPPIAESAEAGYGVAGAEMMPIVPAAAPLPDLAQQSPLRGLSEAPAAPSLSAAVEMEQGAAPDLAAPVAAPAAIADDAGTVAPASTLTSELDSAVETAALLEPNAVSEPVVEQRAEAEPTIVVLAAPSDRQAPVGIESAASPMRNWALNGLAQLLPWLQLALLGAVVVFGLLWQHSRHNP